MKQKDIVAGTKYSMLTVICEVERATFPNSRSKRVFKFLCDCGKVTTMHLSTAKNGYQKSCGCVGKIKIKEANTIHGQVESITYVSWLEMKTRCYNPNRKLYYRYGGRGITICDRWKNSFISFLEDMGERPDKSYSIDRIDPNGNYEPSNCKWATRLEQGQNKENTIKIMFNGCLKPLTDISRENGVSYFALYNQVMRNKLDINDAIIKIKNRSGQTLHG